MDLLGKIIRHSPPLFFPPPPKRTEVSDDANITVISAQDKGFTKTSSPTSNDRRLTEANANLAYTVRYIRSLKIIDADIHAVWPAESATDHETFLNLVKNAKRFNTRLNNSLLSTGGPASRERWLSRVVIGFVSLHDFAVHMHNLQCAILVARYIPNNENAEDRLARVRALKALRYSWFYHQAIMIEKIDRAQADATQMGQNDGVCVWSVVIFLIHRTELSSMVSARNTLR